MSKDKPTDSKAKPAKPAPAQKVAAKKTAAPTKPSANTPAKAKQLVEKASGQNKPVENQSVDKQSAKKPAQQAEATAKPKNQSAAKTAAPTTSKQTAHTSQTKQARPAASKSVEANVKGGEPEDTTSRTSAAQLTSSNTPERGRTKSTFAKRLPDFLQLMRLDKPIGILLLLWPTLWALWLAAKGFPSLKNLVIFCLGVVVMRSAGCVINDFADRKIDGKVQRTQRRPLATGAITGREAIILFTSLCLIAFGLVLMTDWLTIKLSVGGLLLAFGYPFMKRYTHLPQVVLGAAFAWGIPMAYASETGALDKNVWLIYLAVVLWTVVYDTFYAMVDRDDDIKIGVKSTAILFGEQDRFITGALQVMVIYALVLVGKAYELGWIFYLSLAMASSLFIYQQWLIRARERTACFKAFLNNNWVGAVVFVGIAADLAVK